MTRRPLAAGAVAIVACALGAVAPAASAATPTPASSARTDIAGSTAPATTAGNAAGAVPGAHRLSIEVWLTPDATGASQFDDAVSTPGDSAYHQYLSPSQYTARFGPSAAEAQAVSSWLSSEGLGDVTVSPQRDYVSATGSVDAINQAFSVQMQNYQVTSAAGKATTIQANDQPLSVPSSLGADVISVTGLNSTQPTLDHTASPATINRPAAVAAGKSCSQYWAQYLQTITPAFDGITQSPKAVCGYSASQLRDAYGMSTTNTGVGETIALIEVGVPLDMFQTLTDYATSNGLPAPAQSQFSEQILGTGNGNACGNQFDGEEQLDSEAAYAMAPGANQLMVDGDPCNSKLGGVQPLFDAETAVLQGNGSAPSATIESNSWGITGGESTPSIYAETAHAIDLRAAAEGVTMLFSSGDNPGISVPASDPYSTAVGGTTLGIGAGDSRLFETGWSDDEVVKVRNAAWQDQGIGRSAAGGGTSLLYSQPSYQQGVVPASMSTTSAGAVNRAVPDLAADADPNSGILQGDTVLVNGRPKYQTFVDGGTSLASPLVAGMIADAAQGQPTSFGFINPLLYSLASTGAYNDALPVTSSSPASEQSAFVNAATAGAPTLSLLDSQGPAFAAYTDQVTEPGYDTMTGLGTPNGTDFITGLRSGQ